MFRTTIVTVFSGWKMKLAKMSQHTKPKRGYSWKTFIEHINQNNTFIDFCWKIEFDTMIPW